MLDTLAGDDGEVPVAAPEAQGCDGAAGPVAGVPACYAGYTILARAVESMRCAKLLLSLQTSCGARLGECTVHMTWICSATWSAYATVLGSAMHMHGCPCYNKQCWTCREWQ